MAQQFETDADITEHLRQVLDESDPGELAAALGHIAKVRGMTEVAKASGKLRHQSARITSSDIDRIVHRTPAVKCPCSGGACVR